MLSFLRLVSLSLSMCVFSLQAAPLEVSQGNQSLLFNGYFRGSTGISEGGKNQTRFILPGARAKYRLGNEPEINTELKLTYSYNLSELTSHESSLQAVVMMDGFNNPGDSPRFSVDNLAQGYVRLENPVGNGMSIWAGRRYYDRKSIHIMNHYWLNSGQNSHFGGGVENIDAGIGALDVAWIQTRESINGISSIHANMLDFRLRNIALNNENSLTLWGQYAVRNDNSLLGITRETGVGLGGWSDFKRGDLKNTTAFVFQSGAAIVQADFNPRPVKETQSWDLSDARIFEVNNMLTYESLPNYSFQWAAVWRHEDRGGSFGDVDWYSTGIRPVFYLNQYFALAFDAGADYMDDDLNNRDGYLVKFTTALQIARKRGFFERPVIRVFVTGAQWSDDFRGLVGTQPASAPYAADTEGWSAGIQLEHWW